MNNIDLMNYWIKSANEDYETMLWLQKGNKNTMCLFMGQLVIEKILKALYAKNNKNAPYAPKSHDLLYLANKINLELNDEQRTMLDTISDFNLEARYDDYKNEFHNKCTNEYTQKQVNNIKEIRTWLMKLI